MVMAWELGSGGGHLGRLSGVARALTDRGHDVELIARRPESAAAWGFGGGGVAVRAAPPWTPVADPRPPRTWADVMMQTVWAGDVRAHADAWDAALHRARPDVLVADYAPTAVLAARRRGLRTLTIGCGFSRPRAAPPLPDLRRAAGLHGTPGEVTDPAAGEHAALAAVNPLLHEPLARLNALFDGAADLSCSFAELDHLGPEPDRRYLGPFPPAPREPPRWPEGDGPRVFVYAKPFAGLRALMTLLGASGLPTAAFLSGVAAPRTPPGVVVSPQPLDVARCAAEAEIAVCHAGHVTVNALLGAGVPLLLIPLNLEQMLVARRVTALGAGVVAHPEDPESVRAGLTRLLVEPGLTRAARAFAALHAGHDPEVALDAAVRTVLDGA